MTILLINICLNNLNTIFQTKEKYLLEETVQKCPSKYTKQQLLDVKWINYQIILL